MTDPQWTVPATALRKKAREGLIIAAVSPIFLGMPLVFFLVPILAFTAMWRAQSADRQLKKQGEKASLAAAFAVPLGLLVFLISVVVVAANVAEMADRMSKAKRESNPPPAVPIEPPQPPRDPNLVEYDERVALDAQAAHVSRLETSTLAAPLRYTVDEAKHVLALPDEKVAAEVEVAGLRFHVYREGLGVRLDIENTSTGPRAYKITSTPPLGKVCHGALSGFDAIVVTTKETLDCVASFKTLQIDRVETIELAGDLQRFYLDQLTPDVFGIDPVYAKGHEAFRAWSQDAVGCPAEPVPTAAWRDVVDFYARHRCQRYKFPPSYKASDSSRTLPADGARKQ